MAREDPADINPKYFSGFAKLEELELELLWISTHTFLYNSSVSALDFWILTLFYRNGVLLV